MKNRHSLFSRRNALLGAAIVASSGTAGLADMSYANFSTTAGLTLVGAAMQDSDRIMLTPSTGSTAGAVWGAAKQDVSIGFDTTITIHVEDKHGGGADGIALVIQNSAANALGGTGGAMGFARNPVYNQPGIANSFAVELDMWTNTPTQWNEPGANTLSFQSCGLMENMPDASDSLGSATTADFSDGATHTLRVIYTSGLMTVYLDGSLRPALQSEVDLSTLLDLDGGAAWVGVTSGTGSVTDRGAHVLDSWTFTSTAVPSPGVASLMALGGLFLIPRKR